MMQLWAGAASETVKAFEKRPDYVRPFATIVGTMTNAGWYASASINRKFNFSVAVPISLVYLNNRDRQYSGTYTDDGCSACKKMQLADPDVNCDNCVECQPFTAPTIFGSIRTPDVHRSIINLQGDVINTLPPVDPFSDGVEALQDISVMPFVTLQTAFSYYYSEIQLRYMGIPSIEGVSFHFPGIGLQHDFHRFFPSLPVSLSLAAHVTFLAASWKPGENTEGTLKLSGLSNFIGILSGYRITKYLEAFLETGWDNSYLKPSGSLVISEDNKRDVVEPSQTISGRNGFRVALNFSFSINYNPVVGGIAGAQFGNVVNILSYKSKNE